jgi:hypothetical protein
MKSICRLFLSVGLLSLLLVGCSQNNGSNSLFSSNNNEGPVNLFGKTEVRTDEGAATAFPSAKVAIDGADLQKAVHRYKLAAKKKTGTTKVIGADLNGDGIGEALVYFEGDEWCISTGCRLVVFVKGQNGFRKMSEIKRVKLPLVLATSSSEGWRDMIVRSGNTSIGERLVPLRFKGNYPANATTVSEKLTALPSGTQVLLSAQNQVVKAQ